MFEEIENGSMGNILATEKVILEYKTWQGRAGHFESIKVLLVRGIWEKF